MTVVRLVVDPATTPRPSGRVARIAELLDCDEKKVRQLVDQGELEAHGLGRRGLRVFLDSVAEYQTGRRRAAKSPVDKPEKARPISRAAQAFAEQELRNSGILP